MKAGTAVALLALLVVLPSATAHATPLKMSPKTGERLPATPTEVWAEFSERLEGDTRLEVVDRARTHFEAGSTLVQGLRASVAVRTLPEGGYLVQWHTLSAVDGHEASGAWGFAVGNATAPDTPEAQEPPLELGAVLGKALAFAGLALLAGALAFRLLVHPEDPFRLERWGAAVQPLGLVILATVQAGASPTGLVDYFASTDYGRGLLLRLGLALALLLLVLTDRAAAARTTQLVRAALVLVLLTSYGGAGHAAGYAGTLGRALDTAHLTSVTVWSGAVAVLATVLRRPHPTGPPLRAVADRFGRLALACVLVAAGTGSAITLLLLGPPPAWPAALETRYGLALAFKVLVALAMIGFGAVNRLVHVRNLRGRHSFHRAEFAANARREGLVALGVFLLAAVVTNLSPAASVPPGPQPFAAEAEGTVHRFHIEVDPHPSVGNTSTFRVTVWQKQDGRPVADANRLRVTLSPQDPEVAPVQFLLEPVGNGTYERTGAFFFEGGRWHGVVFVQTPRTFSDSAEFDVEVA